MSLCGMCVCVCPDLVLMCVFLSLMCVFRGEDPFCEDCYHSMYGAKCDVCAQYITGRVLEVSGPVV